MSVFMQPIFTQTLTGSAANIVFNNIPQGFTDLQLLVSARSTASGVNSSYMGLTLNNDAGSVYSYIKMYGTGSGVGTYRIAQLTNVGGMVVPAATATANTFGNTLIYFTNYASGNNKSFYFDSVPETNSATFSYDGLELTSGLYSRTSPITQISLFTDTAFAAGTTVTLYGISNVYDVAAPTAPTIGTVTDQAGFASVAFTANDSGLGQTADSYVVTSTPSGSTTYGASSPIVTPATLNTSYTYQVAAVNALGSSSSAASSALTTYNSYTSIATGLAQNVTFSNIPQNYTHLQIRIYARNPAGTQNNTYVQFNGDAGASSYSSHYLVGDGATTSYNGYGPASSYMQMPVVAGASSTAGTFGVAIIDILDYTNTTKFKTVRGVGGNDRNGAGSVGIFSGYWPNLSPISAITCGTVDGNAATGSIVALYGIA